MNQNNRIGIIGAGAFGAAFAQILEAAPLEIDVIGLPHELDKISPHAKLKLIKWELGTPLPLNSDWKWCVLAVPSKALKTIIPDIHPNKNLPTTTFVIISKGIDGEEGLLPFEIMENKAPQHPYLILSGPNFAQEMKEKKMTATTIASRYLNEAILFQSLLTKTPLKAQITTDVIGVSLSGAFKNIIAIAAGMCDELNLGQNARAALITVGSQELGSLIKKMGGQIETSISFAGIGDLLLTSVGEMSRNRQLGKKLARQPDEVQEFVKNHTSEGFVSVQGALKLAQKVGIETPLIQAISDVFLQKIGPKEALIRVLQSIK